LSPFAQRLMSLLKVLFAGGLAVWLGLTVFERVNTPSSTEFVQVPLPEEFPPNQVVVSGLLDCPNSGKNTRAMIDKMTEAQIPYQHITSFSLSNTDDWAGIQRLNEILKRGGPVVFVHGKAKSNPTPDEVIAEYRRGDR